jgi:Bacterial Ig-like domain (group 2)
MRFPPFPQVCSGLLCVLVILIAGCSNPSSQNLASLTVTASPSTVSVGGSSVLKAMAHLSDGTTQDVTSSTQWTLSNSALATLANGAVTAKAAGTVMVQAAYVKATPAGTSASSATTTPQNLSGSTQLTITAAGSTNTPAITWGTPAAIAYGTALSSTQLNATASVAGTFTYTPAAGTVLKTGTQTLSAVFTPTDGTYSAATATVKLTVNQATPAITWAALAPIATGTALSATQLDATANVPGAFAYNPAVGNVPAAGTLQLTATFTPTDTTDYASATAHNTLVVGSGNPTTIQGNACPIPSGASQATIQSTLNSCGSGNTAVFAAGTYSVSSTLNWPCGVSITGPAVPLTTYATGDGYKHLGYVPTATINSTEGPNAWVFSYPACTTPVSFTYMAVNGGMPDGGSNGGGGGGSIYFQSGNSAGITVKYNWFYGNQADQNNDCCSGVLLYIAGQGTNQGYTTMTNMTIAWNQFGSSAGCSNVMDTFFYPSSQTGNNSYNYNNTGGNCAAVAFNTSTANLVEENNVVYHVEEGFKFLEPGPNGGQVGASSAGANQYIHTNANILYNDFSGIHRIAIESQDTPNPTMNYNYNSWHDPVNPGYGTWIYSVPQYDGAGASYSNLNSNVSYNVAVANVPSPTLYGYNGGTVPGIEFWSTGQANYNLVQGYSNCAVQYGYGNSPWQVNYNTYQGSGSAVCNEEHQNTNPDPSQTGNTSSNTVAAVTSVAPTISPAAGGFSGSQAWTVNNPGTNRDTNTGEWCTTDGSTPAPGSGTAQYYASGSGGTVTTTTTVKCVGMWGAANQPASYASGYGYVPSAVVSTTYTAAATAFQPAAKVSSAVTGTDTIATTEAAGNGAAATAELTSVAVVPAQATVAIGSTTQLKAIATFSDGSTKDVTTNFAWASSDTRTITATSSGSLSGLATGKATITGSYQGHQASVPSVSSIGQVEWSAPVVITEAGTYSGNWRSTDSKTPAVTVATTAPVVIESSHISSVAGLIKTSVAGADVTVRNSVALALNPAVKGQANGVFLDASSPARLDVENNYVENAGGGVMVRGYSGNRDGQQTVVIRANRARNLNGLLSDGNGGYLPGVGSNRSVSNFIQLDKVQSVPGIDVGWNEVINYPGRSLVADNIDVKRSSGTPNQPLEIHDTYIQGAYPYTAAQANYQGGGIKTEGSPDDSAQDATAFNNIHDNQVVGTVNYGIAFTAGHDNTAANNRVISSGQLADGTRIAAQYVGMANGDVNGASVANPSMYNNTMHDNLIGWTCWNSSCSQSGYRKDQSFPASPADYSTNSVLAAQPITPQMENNEYQIWLNKTASAGVSVGPAF